MADRHRSSDEIRADIERTRADMDETVEQIGYKLSPGQIVDQMWDKVRAGDAAHSIMDVVRDHPVPSMLMGLGLSWLMYEKTNTSDGERLRRKYGDIGPGTYAPAEGRVGPYRGEDFDFQTDDGTGVADRARSAAASVRDGASSAAHTVGDAATTARDTVSDAAASVKHGVSSAASSVRETVSGARERVGEKVEELRTRAGEARGRAGERLGQVRAGASERASELSHRARDTASHAYDEQPLALGALAFGLGLASGLAVPSSSFEDRVVGERADRLKEEARRTGSEAVEGARRVAAEAQQAARDAISREGVVEELKDKARMVAHEAKQAVVDAFERDGVADTLRNRVKSIARETRDAAMHAAERERIDPEGLKDRVRDTAERVRE